MEHPSMRQLVLTFLVSMCLSCAAPPRSFTYSTALAPTTDHRPGERLATTWRATPLAADAEVPARERICIGVAGPYANEEEAKRGSGIATGVCPVTGDRVVVASAARDVDTSRSDVISQELMLPGSLVPGFYNLVAVRVTTRSRSGGSDTTIMFMRIVAP
jgi:hypothetical protein